MHISKGKGEWQQKSKKGFKHKAINSSHIKENQMKKQATQEVDFIEFSSPMGESTLIDEVEVTGDKSQYMEQEKSRNWKVG